MKKSRHHGWNRMQKRRLIRKQLSAVLAILVAVMTYSSLMLPAISLENTVAETMDGLVIEEAVPEAAPTAEPADNLVPEPVEQAVTEAPGALVAEPVFSDTDPAQGDPYAPAAEVTPTEGAGDSTQPADSPDAAGADAEPTETEPENTQEQPADETDTAAADEENRDPEEEDAADPEDEEDPEETGAVSPLVYEGADYIVRMYFDETAGLPSDAVLSSAEYGAGTDLYLAYQTAVEAALTQSVPGMDVSRLRFFTLNVTDGAGARILPAGSVDVQIEYRYPTNVNDGETFYAVSFRRDEGQPLQAALKERNTDPAQTPAVMIENGTVKELCLLSYTANDFYTEPVIGLLGLTLPEEAAVVEQDAEEAETTEETGTVIGQEFNLTTQVLASSGETFDILVSGGPEAGVPAGAALQAEEISEAASEYEEYREKTEDALGWESGSASYVRFFDIRIVDENGEKIEITAPVNVEIHVAAGGSGKEIDTGAQVVHFADEASQGEIVENVDIVVPENDLETEAESGSEGVTLSFEAEGFSVYAIVDAPEEIYEEGGDHLVDSLDKVALLGVQGFYVKNAGHYLTGGVVPGVTGNSDRYGLQTTENTGAADKAKFYFERVEGTEDQFYIYTKQDEQNAYVQMTKVSGNSNAARAGLNLTADAAAATVFKLGKNSSNQFRVSATVGGTTYYWNRNTKTNGYGAIVGYKDGSDSNTAWIELHYETEIINDFYELDGKSFGIAYHNDSTVATALTAESKTVDNKSGLAGLDMLMRADVLTNNGILLVAENCDIQEWTFENIEEDKYYIRTMVDGVTKYLTINGANVSLTDERDNASVITAKPGTGSNSGKWHFTVNNYSLNFYEKDAKGFNCATGTGASTWMNLVEKSTLTEDDFVSYSARKISASDDILSATEKDENGEIAKDEDGNVIYKKDKTKVVVYTRVWNDTTKKYEFYAVDHDGSLVRVYDSGDLINWVGNQVNSALWEFTEYTNDDGTPSWYYELENTAYPNTFLAPRSGAIIANEAVGLNMEGRQDGFDYTNILAWDDAAYSYSGLKVVKDANGSLKVVTCPLEEADDFHFAVLTPPVEEAGHTTTVATVDNSQYGISIKMVDFNNPLLNDRDSVQNPFFGAHPYNATNPDTGLLTTNLTDGYPKTTEHTGNAGRSLSELFTGMTSVNKLFIQSVYNESGYFEYDSTQNFAHLNADGTFKVYNQLGAVDADTGPTREHGQFMPYNDISEETGYSHDSQGNLLTNQYNVYGQELSDTDPRKGEPLYAIPKNEADHFFGMELSAAFTQTPNGEDNWGHDIIFEFTGDDDFWFYVDGELVLDLGGVHKALGGSVNFKTGDVVCNGRQTALYEIFKANYAARGLDVSAVDNLFEEKVVNGKTVHVFKDYSTHTMKMFYMERGAGASNLKMRFNLASVKPGTVELSKKLKGADSASNKLLEYPYQIWYATAEFATNEDGSYIRDENGDRIVLEYNDPVLLVQPASNNNLTGQIYAVYKDTKTLIPFKDSMEIGGMTYDNVFLLKAGETAVINFPENTYQYKIVECGVDTEVYEHVFVNGDENEIFGKPYNNTDGTDPDSSGETQPESTTTYENSTRSDFGLVYATTEDRPRVEYTNQMAPDVMRTLSFKKVLYDSEGDLMSDEAAANISSTFNFRLYLGNESADENNLSPANKYSYYIKDANGSYCKWNLASRRFESLGITEFEGAGGLAEYLEGKSSEERSAIVFTTSLNGAITYIPAGYTVEVRDLIVGTKYKVEERDQEIPKGYTRRDSDGYVRTDTDPDYVYYTEGGVYGRHELPTNTTAEPISDTIVSKTESPMIEIRNQEGWGLTAEKVWTDKDFMIHDPIYLAVYLKDEQGNPGQLVEDTVRRLKNNETEVYWFFPDLRIGDETYSFDKFMVREVVLTGTPSVDENTGIVSGYDTISPVADGESISIGGKTISGTSRTETYTVGYQTGDSTGQNENIRNDIVTNSRPGLQIYKTDWEGDENLSGVVFTLKDSNGNDVGAATYTSNNEGLVTTAYLSEGTFILKEIKTPAGYVAMDEPIILDVTVTEPTVYDLSVTAGTTKYYITVNGPADFYTTTGETESAMARITVRNREVQELKVVKVGVDDTTNTPLGGVHFVLYGQVTDSEGNLRPAYQPMTGYDDLVTDDSGTLNEITMNLEAGTYYLREKAAPSGYKKLANDLCFTIGEDGTVKINSAGYTNWLSRSISDSGAVSYQITVENIPLGITIRKTDESGKLLPGAQFTLSRKSETDIFEIVSEYGLDENGLIDLTTAAEKTFAGMGNGIYKLTETHAPAGYIIITKDIYFSVSDGAVKLTDEDGNETAYSSVTLADDNTTIVVKNTPGVALPTTGGPGISLLYFLGGMLVLFAGAGLTLLCRKKRAG